MAGDLKPGLWFRKEFPEAKVDVELLDLSDLDSVRAFGQKAQNDSQHLDVLLNNAGAAFIFFSGSRAQQFNFNRQGEQRSLVRTHCPCVRSVND